MNAPRRNYTLKHKPKKELMPTGSVAEAVSAAIAAMTNKLKEGEVKPTVGDFVRLLELQRDLVHEHINHIKLTWVDLLNETEYTTEI